MPYSDLIMQESEYTYSANIQFDIENDRKLLRFIPNDTTTALLKEYFTDITRQNPENHARILYGSYGTGKSHFLTVLSLLLSKSHTDGFAFETFTDRLSRYDAGLASDIASFVHNPARKPFLVVPIVFDFEDFDRCIYFSLKKKLDGLDIPVQFKTFYDQATQLIEQWKSAADSKKRLEEACNAAKIKLPTLEAQLHRYDKRAEKRFQRLFSVMTYGVTYVYEISNLSEAIKQANMAISKEYCGIIFIFDEFGRYIEDNIKSVKVKSIQDLAEICDHTEGNNHVILVSHKEISQYTQRYGKNISNEWKKVEGRYKATPINDKQDQCLSLISSILTKNPDLWRVFEGQFRAELNQIYSEAIGFQAPQTGVVLGENPYEGGFPLHPISLFALDKLSKKVAQNERTFFTYLASKEEHSLYQFLESHELEEFHFVGIDSIYDYFEPNIKAVQSDSSYEWYRNLQHALAKNNSNEFDDSPETRILKVIAAIGIINDSSSLVADKRTIFSVIDAPNEQLEAALKGLCDKKIIKYSGAYKRYDFFEASIFDVEGLIKEGTRQVQDKAVIDTLNEHFIDFVLYPSRYNREYKINRIFLPIFATNEELTRKTLTSRFGDYYDGILAIVLANEDVDLQEIALQSSYVERGLVVVHKDTGALVFAVKQYIAIQYLYSKKEEFNSKDPAFEKELQYYADEITVVIKNMVGAWNSSFEEDTFIYYNGVKQEDIHSISDLSDLASRILYEAYPQTLIVNNELINKNTVSGSIMAAKRNVLNGMIRGELPGQYYGVQTLSPDYLAVRSVLVKNGFVETDEAVDENELNNGFQPQREVNAVITRYINAAREGSIDVSELYRELKQTPYGLRDGYLSILFARFLVPHKRSLIITSHGVEQELTAELFEELVRRPKDYSFTIASWSKEQLDYFDALTELFSDFINPAALGKNRVKAIYADIFKKYILDLEKALEDEQDLYFRYDDKIRGLLLILQKFGIQMFYPYVIMRLKEVNQNESDPQLREDFQILESFVVRRKLSPKGTHDYTSKCYEIIKHKIGVLIQSDLGNRDAGLTDADIKRYLSNTKDDTAKMVLFWIELRRRRGDAYDINALEYNYTLEHIMPKKWKTHWSEVPIVDGKTVYDKDSDDGIHYRDSMIQSIGNKTLLKSSLNSAVKNADFMTKIKGIDGRRPGYDQHTALMLTRDLVAKSQTDQNWDEKHISDRTNQLFGEFVQIWPSFADRVQVSAPISDEDPNIDQFTQEQLSDAALLAEIL